MTDIATILEKKAERVAHQKELKAQREENGERQPLIIEMEPEGLYYARYEKGPVPNDLKGKFTRIQRILDIARSKNIPVRGY